MRIPLCLVLATACAPKTSTSFETERRALSDATSRCDRLLDLPVAPAEEASFGDGLKAKWLGRGTITRAVRSDARLSKLGALVTKASARPERFSFLLVEDAAAGVFSAPPGTVLVTKGAVEVLSDDALAGVLAHEVAHLEHGDAIAFARKQRVERCKLTVGAQQTLDATARFRPVIEGVDAPSRVDEPPLSTLVDSLFESFLRVGYGEGVRVFPEQERRADVEAARVLRQVGLSVQKYAAELERVPHPGMSPTSVERRSALEALR